MLEVAVESNRYYLCSLAEYVLGGSYMSKRQIKITVNSDTANYLRGSLLSVSGCVEELVYDVLHNESMGVERKTIKKLTNATKKWIRRYRK